MKLSLMHIFSYYSKGNFHSIIRPTITQVSLYTIRRLDGNAEVVLYI